MSFRTGTQKYGTSVDEFVMIDGYNRNLALEKRLQQELEQVNNEVSALGEFNPNSGYALPSWWETVSDPGGYGWGFDTHQKALDYLKLSKRFHEAKINSWEYACKNYPRDTVFCQHASQYKGILGRINTLIPIIQNRITGFEFPQIFPEVFAEEDPSVNSGLNGNEQESQVINYPQSANVRIVISNISMFSTSIPINDISQLQILSNASNEWRYTLIGSSTNQPLMTLSGLVTKINSMIASAVTPQPPETKPPVTQPEPEPEPEPTTIHIPPPETMPTQEQGESCEAYRSRLQSLGWHVDWISNCPTPTPTPTEPGQINWIPEPFFSFINNVFRK